MNKNIFLSYSRTEIHFTQSLGISLENLGHSVWVDFRRLVSGKKWADQLHDGIKDADTVILVMSKSSIKSKNVQQELKWATEANKRIILVLFETTSLPKELQEYEWVDFRDSFTNSIIELNNLLNSESLPKEKRLPTPQNGFKLPRGVRLFFIVSCINAALSLTFLIPFIYAAALNPNSAFLSVSSINTITTLSPRLYTYTVETGSNQPSDARALSLWIFMLPLLLVPYILLPLPIQIATRSFKRSQVGLALISQLILTLGLLTTTFIEIDTTLRSLPISIAVLTVTVLSPVPTLIALIMLSTSWDLYRWVGRRDALTSNKFPKAPYVRDHNPKKIMIEHHESDIYIANFLASDLRVKESQVVMNSTQHNQKDTAPSDYYDVILVILSTFKSKSIFDPEKTPGLIPIVIQNTYVDVSLSNIEWIDLSRHLTGNKLAEIARNIRSIQKLKDELGVLPIRTQQTIPSNFLTLISVLLILGYLGIASTLLLIIWSLQGVSIHFLGIIFSVAMAYFYFNTVNKIKTRSITPRKLSIRLFLLFLLTLLTASISSSNLVGTVPSFLYHTLFVFVPIGIILATLTTPLKLWLPSKI